MLEFNYKGSSLPEEGKSLFRDVHRLRRDSKAWWWLCELIKPLHCLLAGSYVPVACVEKFRINS